MQKYSDGVTRRDALRAGVAGAFGLSLPSLLQLDAAEKPGTKAKNAIFIFLTGGQSHIDTWDMKPDAGDKKGEFQSIATNVSGLRVCEHMPYLAKQADKYAIVRNVSHTQGAHSPGQRYLQTGNRKIPSLEYPDYGSVVSKELQSPRGVPEYVLLPSSGSNSASYSSGYLGVAHGPFTALGDPNSRNYSVRALATPTGLTADKISARQRLLKRVDTRFRKLDLADQDLEGMDKSYQKAFDIMQSKAVRKAFDIGSESTRVREQYGRHTFGQSCLLARRLVEAGNALRLDLQRRLGHAPVQLPRSEKQTAATLGSRARRTDRRPARQWLVEKHRRLVHWGIRPGRQRSTTRMLAAITGRAP